MGRYCLLYTTSLQYTYAKHKTKKFFQNIQKHSKKMKMSAQRHIKGTLFVVAEWLFPPPNLYVNQFIHQ